MNSEERPVTDARNPRVFTCGVLRQLPDRVNPSKPRTVVRPSNPLRLS